MYHVCVVRVVTGVRKDDAGELPREAECCSMGVAEDEVCVSNMVFECPKYQTIRMGFIDLFLHDWLENVAADWRTLLV